MYKSLTYGNVIKELRTNRFLSQGELAEDICSQGMLSRIENNDVVPNVLVMQKICEKLNVSIHYVLTREEAIKAPVNQWLEKLKQDMHGKRFDLIRETIAKIEQLADPVFVTKLELQEYAYYHGCAKSEANDQLGALAILQKGLNYTYNRQSQTVTDLEILLLSEIGLVYYIQGNFEKGLSFLRRSISQFYASNKRRTVDLSKIFYNIATVFIDLKAYNEALEYLEYGILWCQKQKSFYRLDDLYLLKALVFQDTDRFEEAIETVEIAETLEKLVADAS
ncbi:helix-turn-helix transcriptional regulator [Vagococcus sp. BWB3-3]|uniref:Helix-turn-helix transcriptional regulator n=1 Tax=Vagococcus allomyrinae TaxID=2794353 RepID=A0A940P9E1_9ENTE|nr:helix-turn-helix transcriptional regulator [Vagococcus allomyrinae]MBP1040525.1 helix-turn-helix transcriptional regulator [Vagococcus allomyrinae]